MKVEILRTFMKITYNNNNLLNGFLVLVATNRRNVRRRTECFLGRVFAHLLGIKGVRAHCYCASLVHTLYMTWHGRHVFQARAPSRNSTKYRADDLCGNLICKYFCWMLGDPHIFFGRSLPFLILSIILRNKKKCVRGKF